MATIDAYKHKLLDFFYCPSDYNLVNNNSTKKIAIYILEENVPDDEYIFDGNVGDFIVGGGSGEVQSLRISQKAIKFFKNEDFEDFDSIQDIVKSFWSPNTAFNIGTGLIKLGWNPDYHMELWMAEKIINQLIEKNKI